MLWFGILASFRCFNFSSAWIIYFFSPSGHAHRVSKTVRRVVSFFCFLLNWRRTRVRPWIAWGTGLKQQGWERRCIQNQEHTPWALFIFGGFCQRPQGFFLKIWAVLQDFGRGLRLCHGVSTQHPLCSPTTKTPNPELPLPSPGQDFTLESFAEVSFSYFHTFSTYHFPGQCLLWVLQRRAGSNKHSPHVSEAHTPRSAINLPWRW